MFLFSGQLLIICLTQHFLHNLGISAVGCALCNDFVVTSWLNLSSMCLFMCGHSRSGCDCLKGTSISRIGSWIKLMVGSWSCASLNFSKRHNLWSCFQRHWNGSCFWNPIWWCLLWGVRLAAWHQHFLVLLGKSYHTLRERVREREKKSWFSLMCCTTIHWIALGIWCHSWARFPSLCCIAVFLAQVCGNILQHAS